MLTAGSTFAGYRIVRLLGSGATVEIDPRAEHGTFVTFGCTPWAQTTPLPGDW